jgi:hypothetical protein
MCTIAFSFFRYAKLWLHHQSYFLLFISIYSRRSQSEVAQTYLFLFFAMSKIFAQFKLPCIPMHWTEAVAIEQRERERGRGRGAIEHSERRWPMTIEHSTAHDGLAKFVRRIRYARVPERLKLSFGCRREVRSLSIAVAVSHHPRSARWRFLLYQKKYLYDIYAGQTFYYEKISNIPDKTCILANMHWLGLYKC